MKKNPETPPNIQMTPVEFSPKQTGEDIGVIAPASREENQYPVFLPMLILMLTLLYSTGRDIVTLNRQMVQVNQEIAPGQEMLKNAGKQNEFIDSMRKDLTKLGTSDPVAARIVRDYFPATPPVVPKKPAPDDAAKPPADTSNSPADTSNSPTK